MMEKIKKLLTKEMILYIIFGLCTTIINFTSFYIMAEIWRWEKNSSHFISIILAVIFAYITNRNLVFHSNANMLKEKLKEFFKFILGRAFTLLVEFFGGIALFQTAIPEIISKLIITILVVILNFFISKFIIFKTKK